jgi:hypothetical protein
MYGNNKTETKVDAMTSYKQAGYKGLPLNGGGGGDRHKIFTLKIRQIDEETTGRKSSHSVFAINSSHLLCLFAAYMNVKRSYALSNFLGVVFNLSLLDAECRTPYIEIISVSYLMLIMPSLNGFLLNSSEGHARMSSIMIT